MKPLSLNRSKMRGLDYAGHLANGTLYLSVFVLKGSLYFSELTQEKTDKQRVAHFCL